MVDVIRSEELPRQTDQHDTPSGAGAETVPLATLDDGYDLTQVQEVARSARTATNERASRSSAWFLAISLALNAGACVALFGAIDKIGFSPQDYIYFFLGLAADLASSALLGFLAYVTADHLADLENAVFEAQNSGSKDHSAITATHDRLQHGKVVRNAPMVLRFVSVALFFLGIANLLIEIPRRLEPAAHRCLEVQNEMLSAVPRRTDSREVFQALGCRPQGGGRMMLPAAGLQQRRSLFAKKPAGR